MEISSIMHWILTYCIFIVHISMLFQMYVFLIWLEHLDVKKHWFYFLRIQFIWWHAIVLLLKHYIRLPLIDINLDWSISKSVILLRNRNIWNPTEFPHPPLVALTFLLALFAIPLPWNDLSDSSRKGVLRFSIDSLLGTLTLFLLRVELDSSST